MHFWKLLRKITEILVIILVPNHTFAFCNLPFFLFGNWNARRGSIISLIVATHTGQGVQQSKT